MNKVFLLIGGNLGNRFENLQRSKELIEKRCGRIILSSAVYETAAWGKTDQPSFLNEVIELETSLLPQELMREILGIEKQLGRFRKEKFGPRIIDIDILFYNDEVITAAALKIPHPEIQNRRFVLEPLASISPNFVHPVLKKNIRQLLQQCSDTLEVKLYR